jgi:hypothetical protein
MNDPTGCVAIIFRRRRISCWIESNRDTYDWSVAEAIRLHPGENIHAGWTFTDTTGVWEDRTRYNVGMGRKDFRREFPFLVSPRMRKAHSLQSSLDREEA